MRSWWCRFLLITLAVMTILIGLAAPAYAIDPTAIPEPIFTAEPTVLPTETVEPTIIPPSPTPLVSLEPTVTPTLTSSPLATATPLAIAPPPVSTATPDSTTPAIIPQQAATLRLEITKTLVGSAVVQVGTYLTFTVRIRNTGSVTVTTLPLIDEYDPAVLQPILNRFQPAPDQSTTGRLDWRDLTDLPGFGDLAPGAEFTITTVFRAIGISDSVINRARIEAALGSGGLGGGSTGSSNTGTIQGGSVTIEKALLADMIRADAPAVSFAITIRNTGAADLVRVPVDDLFDPSYLRFVSAQPAPDRADPITGSLGWDNILAGLGLSRLKPGEVVTATTTFAVLAPIDNLVVNRIAGRDVRDEFGNAVQAPRQADVRIRIIGVADTRPIAQPTTEAPQRRRTATPTTPEATATAVESATAISTAVIAVGDQQGAEGVQASAGTIPAQTGPATLPRTGGTAEQPWFVWLGFALLMLGAGGLFVMRQRGAGMLNAES